MRHLTIVRAGGVSLIFGAFAFVLVFSYLAARFGYPDVLDGQASEVLPELLSIGSPGRLAWAIYGFLPLIWIPAAVGAFHALRHTGEGAMRVATFAAALSSIAMMLGLLRWPSLHWELAEAFVAADPAGRAVISAVFAGFNSYLGNYIGEFLGELCFSVFFLLSGRAMLDVRSGFPRWFGYWGLLTALAGLIGMLRNVTEVVLPIADINNFLLPLWMVAFGIGLLRVRGQETFPLPVPRQTSVISGIP